jgi:dihydroorotase
MSELLALGMTLPEVVATVTSNAAEMLREIDRLGALAPGRVADISILDPLTGRFRLTDNTGAELIAELLLHPAFCLRAGRRFDADSPLLPDASLLAA